MANIKADRYRAYTEKQVQNRGAAEPHTVEEVAFSGKTGGEALAKFDAGDTKVTRVVFYAGPVTSETVVGAVDINKSGKVTAEVVSAE